VLFKASNQDQRLATYYGQVAINNQLFNVIFDTGSCEFWVPSSQCGSQMCQKHRKYDASYTKVNDLMIYYMSGRLAGDFAVETVHLGNLAIANQHVGFAKEINIPILDDVVWDGIVGLAFANKKL
jgi:cathepsin D